MRPLFEKEGFLICFEAEPEDQTIRKHFQLCGYGESQIKQLERKVREGKAVWFTARVSAWRDGVELAAETIGGCYYRNHEEFVNGGDYFPQMVDSAIVQAKQVKYVSFWKGN